MSDHPAPVELPVRLGPGLETLSHEIIGACNDTSKFAFWAEDWIAQGNQVYRAHFALPPAISKAERVMGLDAIIATVQLTGEGQASISLQLNLGDDRPRFEGAFREFVDRLTARLEHAGFSS